MHFHTELDDEVQPIAQAGGTLGSVVCFEGSDDGWSDCDDDSFVEVSFGASMSAAFCLRSRQLL